MSVTEPVGREDFSIEDEFIFSNICQAAAVAIHNHLAIAKVERSNVEFLETLIKAIEDDGKVAFDIVVDVQNTAGETVVEMTVNWYVSPNQS